MANRKKSFDMDAGAHVDVEVRREKGTGVILVSIGLHGVWHVPRLMVQEGAFEIREVAP